MLNKLPKDDAYKHHTTQKCFFCEIGQPSNYFIFDENEYHNNPFLGTNQIQSLKYMSKQYYMLQMS